ncbi:MAG: putative two-component response regulator [Glaciihabitans sp.]|nr:putative two-component response regulator [Glaciihabitans sp.]
MTTPFAVLSVDDDFRIAGLHAGIVDATPRFRSVGTVGTVAGALSLIASEKPDLVLLDAYLPDQSGLELVRRIDADVIMITAANDSAVVRRALRHGAFSYLIKPFDPTLLRQKLGLYAAYRDAFAVPRALEQSSLDRAIAAAHTITNTAARARPATEQAVLDVLFEKELPWSAPEIAERIGVSRATAQRHLGMLAADRVVDVQLRYGATGRPEHRYSAVRDRPTG